MRVLLGSILLLIIGGNQFPVNTEIMKNSPKSIWFEGSNEIHHTIKHLEDSLKNTGKHFTGIIDLMPGITSVELIQQGRGYVMIKTNEGLMKRTNISITADSERIVVEFDEDHHAYKSTRNICCL
jgi:hypothetical protein